MGAKQPDAGPSLEQQLTDFMADLDGAERLADAEALQQGIDLVHHHGNIVAFDMLASLIQQMNFGDSESLSEKLRKHIALMACTTKREDQCRDPTGGLGHVPASQHTYRLGSKNNRQREPIGIELDLDLQLPEVTMASGSIDIKTSAADLRIRCPAEVAHGGLAVPSSERQANKIECNFSGFECVVRDLASELSHLREGFKLLRMPSRMLVLLSYTVVDGAMRLLPWTIESIDLDLWAFNASGKVCCASEQIAVVTLESLRQPASTLVKYVIRGISDVLSKHTQIQGVSRSQLQVMAKELLGKHAYMQWLVPRERGHGISLSLSIHFRVMVLCLSKHFEHDYCTEEFGASDLELEALVTRFLSNTAAAFQTEIQRVSSFNLHRGSTKVIDSVVLLGLAEDITIVLGGNSTCLNCESICFGCNSALAREFADFFVEATRGVFNWSHDQFDYDKMPEGYERGATIYVEIPSRACQMRPRTSDGMPLSPVTIVPVRNHRALDGFTVLVPSARITMQSEDRLVIDTRVVRVRMEGIVASVIVEQHIDSAAAASRNFLEAICSSEEGRMSELFGSMSELQDAIKQVCSTEILKGCVSRHLSHRSALHRVSLSFGMPHHL